MEIREGGNAPPEAMLLEDPLEGVLGGSLAPLEAMFMEDPPEGVLGGSIAPLETMLMEEALLLRRKSSEVGPRMHSWGARRWESAGDMARR